MKTFLFLLIFLEFSISCGQMNIIRHMFHNIHNKNQLQQFIKNTEDMDCIDAKPYYASAIMQKAKHTLWPLTKLKHFKTGKKMLEQFIKTNPEHLEAKYIRILIQSEIPGFLGYKDNIQSDGEYILENLNNSLLDTEMKELFKENVLKILENYNQ